MTNINCSSDCVYQKDGKCNLENVDFATIFGDDKCVYYTSSSLTAMKNQEELSK